MFILFHLKWGKPFSDGQPKALFSTQFSTLVVCF